MKTNPSDLAYAYRQVARVNHYLVGVCAPETTVEDYDAAEQLLIATQNAIPNARTTARAWKQCELALDLLQNDRKALRGY